MSELCDLRHRYKLHVILVHPRQCAKELRQVAHRCFPFEALTADLPHRVPEQVRAGVLEERLRPVINLMRSTARITQRVTELV